MSCNHGRRKQIKRRCHTNIFDERCARMISRCAACWKEESSKGIDPLCDSCYEDETDVEEDWHFTPGGTPYLLEDI